MHLAIIGSSGGLGQALLAHYADRVDRIEAVSRQPAPTQLPDNVRWHQVAGELDDYQTLLAQWQHDGLCLQGVISTIGWLHNDEHQPERRLESLEAEQLQQYFLVNATLPLMLLKWLKPLLPTQESAFVAQLGAKVGSIGDNRLGGWYGYRGSKAALNMFYKTAAIELRRTHAQLSLAVIHPGTTDTALSAPFQKRIAAGKLYSPQQSATRIAKVIADLQPKDSGGFWFWDGTQLPY